MRRSSSFAAFLFALLVTPSLLVSPAPAFAQDGPVVLPALKHDLSPRLTQIARKFRPPKGRTRPDFEIPELHQGVPGAPLGPAGPDPVVQDWVGEGLIPSPELSFEGLNNDDNFATLGVRVTPPDTNGDIGPNHYVQTVNLIFAIYDRAGTRLLGPLPNNALWAGFGGDCETRNNGDPIVLYDHLADRWLLSQFTTASPYHQCVAISQTGDPTGAWYRYDFGVPSGRFNDYPKFGVWPDAYYMSAGTRGIPGPVTDVFAYERARMLNGQSAQMVWFATAPSLGYVAPMPADLDGPPPPAGAPNPFVGVKQSAPQALYIFAFHVDWTTPANSTFGLGGMPNETLSAVAPFTILCPGTRNCVPQPPPAAIGLDALAGRYVMYRAQYRNFGTHESIVFNGTVDAGGQRAGVRWYEIRDPNGTPVIHQQGTYAPADGVHRWMGSAAMDRQGNLAIGFSASSATDVFPSIYYAGRLASDPPGELSQGEAVMITGNGIQSSTGSRWGDYSMMAVDPVDDCTFWYTTEYYAVTSVNVWQTRIGRFRFPGCLAADFAVSANPSSVTIAAGGTGSTTASVQSINGFSSLVSLSCASVAPAGVSCGFAPGEVTPPPNGSADTTLTFTVHPLTAPASYPIYVIGTSGGMRRSALVTVTVTGAPVLGSRAAREAR